MYERLFSSAEPRHAVVGEASVNYAFSHTAARNIHAYAPAARIVFMIRNPIDLAASAYGRAVYGGDETLTFDEALATEEARWAEACERAPAGMVPPPRRFYRRIAGIDTQLRRYLDTFGEGAVFVAAQEDLRTDPSSVWRPLLEFLNVDRSFEPRFGTVNETVAVRSASLQRLARLVPKAVRHRAVRAAPQAAERMLALNARVAPKAAMTPALRVRLRDELRDQVDELCAALDRDLTRIWPDFR